MNKIAFLSLLSSLLLAEENNLSNDLNLVSFFDDVSTIATKTKLNIDHQPSVVSVYHGSELSNLGIQTLHEALGLVPGFESYVAHNSSKHTSVRGAHNPNNYIFDKVKLLVDGVDVSAKLHGAIYHYLDFPIELIERIEVLRGAASSIYGHGAFNAAVNVITKISKDTNQNLASLTLGSYDFIKGSVLSKFTTNGWEIGLDAYYQKLDKELDVPNGIPFSAPFVEEFARDYTSLEDMKDYGLGLHIKKEAFSLDARYKMNKAQNHQGFLGLLEPSEDNYNSNEAFSLEARYEHKIDDSSSFKVAAGLMHYAYVLDDIMIQYTPNPYGLEDYHNVFDFSEETLYIEPSITASTFDSHTITLGAYLGDTRVKRNKVGVNASDYGGGVGFPDGTGGYSPISKDLTYFSGNEGFIGGDKDQKLYSLYFQDIYSLNSKLDLALNIRYDNYSLFDAKTSYRLASVYEYTEQNIFKLIYGRAYRLPSYGEAFVTPHYYLFEGNPNLTAESVDTYELAYIHKATEYNFRTNVYYSVYKDIIDVFPSGGLGADYINTPSDRNSYGLELEYKQNFQNRSHLAINGTWSRSDYKIPTLEARSPNTSEIILNSSYVYPITNSLTSNSLAYYFGPKDVYNNENDIPSLFILDQTFNYAINENNKLRFTVKNLFDRPLVYASVSPQLDNIQREGRTVYFTYLAEF